MAEMIVFDFINRRVVIRTSTGAALPAPKTLALAGTATPPPSSAQ